MRRFTRRDVLGVMSGAAGAAILGARAVDAGALGLGAADSPGPRMVFPTGARERLAVATWPFRAWMESPTNGEYRDKKLPGMDLADFAVRVKETFGVPGVEPLSMHFPSTDSGYLGRFRERIERAGVRAVNIPVDNQHSYYAADAAERKKAVENGKKWVDVAVAIGAPSVRTSIAEAKDSKPNAGVAAESIRRVGEYAAAKNIVVNLENDNLVSEDAFFVVEVIEKVGSPWVHALPDFCNSMAKGDEAFGYEALRKMFSKAYSICHVKDSEADEGKVFRVDVVKAFGILRASGYRGYCSMEFEGEGDPYEGTKRLIASSLQGLGA